MRALVREMLTRGLRAGIVLFVFMMLAYIVSVGVGNEYVRTLVDPAIYTASFVLYILVYLLPVELGIDYGRL